MNLPLLHPKATVTSDHHPCGAELLEFPFSAKAFYVGESSHVLSSNAGSVAKYFSKLLIKMGKEYLVQSLIESSEGFEL